jgi:hypothetical protein
VRRFVTVLAVTVGGLCFLFSLGNVYQLAVDLQLWVWIRPLVAPAVDLSIVALVVGIRFLARRGVGSRALRRPRLFMLAVGLAAWALNTAGAVGERNWGRAAFDSLAPGLLIGWAEVLPWFLRQFHASTHPAVPADPSVPVPAAAAPPDGNGGLVPAVAASPGPPPGVPAVPARALSAGGGNGNAGGNGAGGSRGTPTAPVGLAPGPADPPAPAGRAGANGTARPVPPAARAENGTGGGDADAGMRAWWAAERAAGRTPSGADLDRVCGRNPKNGTGRKARARFLREEAAGRYHAPAIPPAVRPAPQAVQPPQVAVPATPVLAAAPGAPGPTPGPGPTGRGSPPRAAGLPAPPAATAAPGPAGSRPRG